VVLAKHDTRLSVDFDAQEDVLYISLGKPVPSYAEEAPDGVLLRRSNAEDQPSGVTALDFRNNWLAQRKRFYALVADYLHIPATTIEREVESRI
jgi:hypothetical protein